MNAKKLKQEFDTKKKSILRALASGSDASPKGNVDSHILPIMKFLNSCDGVVTTSSCSGRMSIYLEGMKGDQTSGYQQPQENEPNNTENVAAIGGKGGGGKWLFVSHDIWPEEGMENIDIHDFLSTLFGGNPSEPACQLTETISSQTRFIHFKFEPMILHVLVENLELANRLLVCAIASSFRESGIVSPLKNPVVAIRTTGLAFDAPVGIYHTSSGSIGRLMEPLGLKTLVRLANSRFNENFRRIASLTTQLESGWGIPEINTETKQERARRKRAEGSNEQKREKVKESQMQLNDPLEGGISF